MPKAPVNGIDIHYVRRGEGRDVILLHGVTSSLAMWYNGIYPKLSENYRVTAYDLRGHGLSGLTPTGYTSADMAEDLLGLLDSLKIEKATLIGHSFGGAIGLHMALLHPDRVHGVIMLDSGLACLRYLRIIADWQGWKGRPEEFQKKGLSLEQFLELDSKQDVTAVIRHGLNMPRVGGFRKGQSGMTPRLQRLLDETKLGYEFRDVAGMTEERLRTVLTPVLALYGETSPYQKMAKHLNGLLPNCRHEVLPGTGHFSAIHRPELVAPVIQEFVADPIDYVKNAPDSVAVAP
ncbi:MAG: alpha/beta fold hydrolase [Bryobacteraceae bacterium]